MGGRKTHRNGAAAIAVFAACLAGAAPAKEAKVTAQKQSAAAAYIDQIDAPPDWKTNVEFWVALASFLPSDIYVTGAPKVVIADPGNIAIQTQTGVGQSEFVLQWGTGNSAAQDLGGSHNRAESVQISPGASMARKANAGAGNGGEFDVFGFELDPGNSGWHNKSPEAGDAGSAGPGGNVSVQRLTGAQNVGRIAQVGWANYAEQVQQGTGNLSVIVQLGAQNRAETVQSGSQNASLVVQEGTGNSVSVVQ
jgi:hypothetical protein